MISFPQVSPPEPCAHLFPPHTRHMPHPSHSSRFYHQPPKPQAGGPPLVGFRDCLFNLFAATLHRQYYIIYIYIIFYYDSRIYHNHTTAFLLTHEVSFLYGINSTISRKSLFGSGSESARNIDFMYFKILHSVVIYIFYF